ncbi:MAG: radical SAM protein [Endomicrobia bacterium]|nr:radical SAM protein [Endomicrobiia bacterium]
MKFLLINPPIYDFSAYDVWVKPLGLLYLSNILKRYNYEVILLDCLDRNFFVQLKPKPDGTGKYPSSEVSKPEVLKDIPLAFKRYGISQKQIIDFISNHKDSDYVIVTSSMTYWYLGVKEIVELIKDYLPNSKIILGGIYPILLPKHSYINFAKKVNFVFTKAGFYDLLEYLNLPQAKTYKSFTCYPKPDYFHYKNNYYVVLRFSYGCFNNCIYCASKQIHPHFQNKIPTQITEEIAQLFEETKSTNFVIYDDALLSFSKYGWICEILGKISGLNLDIKFYTPNGINPKFIDYQIAKLLRDANFVELRLSLETTSDKTHKLVDKKVSMNDFEKALNNLIKAGYRQNEISVYIMAGLPNETLEDVYKNIEVLIKYKIRIRLCELSLVPKTKLFSLLCHKEDVDPLLLNNSIFLFNGIAGKIKPWCKYEDFQKLKEFLRTCNTKNLKEQKINV